MAELGDADVQLAHLLPFSFLRLAVCDDLAVTSTLCPTSAEVSQRM